MKKISFWAKKHKPAARLIIILSFILLIVAGFMVGNFLNELKILIPTFCFVCIMTIYFLALLLYPSHYRKVTVSPNKFYRWQKTCDLVLAASAFLLMVYVSNDKFSTLQNFSIASASASSGSLPADSNRATYKSLQAFSVSLKNNQGEELKWKEKKKLLKEQVRAIKKTEGISKGGKVLLIILSVIAAIGLFSIVASLSCSLSCSGSTAAAFVVGFGGTALIVLLLIKVIRSINKKHRNSKPEEAVSTD